MFELGATACEQTGFLFSLHLEPNLVSKYFNHLHLLLLFLPDAGERRVPPPRAVHYRERSVNSNSQGQEERAQISLQATDRRTVR